MTEFTAIATIEQEKASTIELVNVARALKVVDTESRLQAEDVIEKLKAREDFWDKLTQPNKAAAYAAYQTALRLHDDPIAELKEARLGKNGKGGVKQQCIAYDAEQERLRREEQRRLEEEARKRAEEEQIAAALQAEAEGDKDAAQAIIDEPVYVPPVTVPRPPVQPSRWTAGRSDWSAEVTDFPALVKAATVKPELLAFIQADLVALNKVARAMHSAMNVPGVKAVERKV